MSSRSIIKTSGAILILGRTHAYKCFYGRGALRRLETELDNHARARACPVWGHHVAPTQRISRFILRSGRGQLISHDRPDQLALAREFVEERLALASRGHQPVPVIDLLDLEKIEPLFGGGKFPAALEKIAASLRDAQLPGGPAHGDLHHGNIILLDGRPKVIDCDRYARSSAPIFDRLHFALSERQKQNGERWFDTMTENEDIAHDALRAEDVDTATVAQLVLAYGLNRLALDADDRMARHRPIHKYTQLAAKLLTRYSTNRSSPRALRRLRVRGPRALRGSSAFLFAMRLLWRTRWLFGRKAERGLLRLINPNRRRFLPPGVEALEFFRRLDNRGSDYVLLRWSNDLARLAPTQDLDVLVSDGCVPDVLSELSLWPIGRSVDLYSVSGVSGTTYSAKIDNGAKCDVPVFPSALSRQILERRVRHDDMCNIPCAEDRLWSLAYHVTYLKGAASGLPLRSLDEPRVEATHDYAATLRALATSADIRLDGDITRLRLAELLSREGWAAPEVLTAKLHSPSWP